MDIQIIAAALLSFILFLISIAILFRITAKEDAIVWVMRACLGIGILTGMYWTRTWKSEEIFFFVSLYGLLVILFVFGIFSIMEASLTLRIFSEIAKSNGITLRDVLEKNNKKVIVKRRIDRLLHSGEIKKLHGMYTLGGTSYFRLREYFTAIFKLAFG